MPIYKIRRMGHLEGIADEFPVFEDSPEAALDAYNADEEGRGEDWPLLRLLAEGVGGARFWLVEENEHLQDVDHFGLGPA